MPRTDAKRVPEHMIACAGQVTASIVRSHQPVMSPGAEVIQMHHDDGGPSRVGRRGTSGT